MILKTLYQIDGERVAILVLNWWLFQEALSADSI